MLMNVLVPSEGDTAIRIPQMANWVPERCGNVARPWVTRVTDLGVESRLLVPVPLWSFSCLGPGARLRLPRRMQTRKEVLAASEKGPCRWREQESQKKGHLRGRRSRGGAAGE